MNCRFYASWIFFDQLYNYKLLRESCNMELYKLVNCSGSQYSTSIDTALMILTYFLLVFLSQFLQLILIRQINLIELPAKVKYVSICICLCLL